MTRRGYSAEHIDAIKDAYKRLYRDNGAPMSDKIVELKRQYRDVPAVVHLCDSLAAAAEGVHGRAREIMRHDNKRHSHASAGVLVTEAAAHIAPEFLA